MKKRTAMIMALVMTASTMFAGTAFAEAEAEEAAAEAVELSWDMVADKAAEVEGDFVTFDEIAVKIWVPAEMQAVELTEEDVENGYIGYYSNEEKGWNMAVVYANVEGMSIEDATKLATAAATLNIAAFGPMEGKINRENVEAIIKENIIQ